MTANTMIRYHYVDGSNWKKDGVVVLAGAADAALALRFQTSLDDDGFFVPQAVGLPPLAPYGERWSDDDHVYTRLLSLEPTDAPVDDPRDIAALLVAFEAADWDSAAEEHRRKPESDPAEEDEDDEASCLPMETTP